MTLTVLSLLVGSLIVSTSPALLYAAWLSGAGNEMTAQFLALASVCGLGFAILGGWLTALVARRAPIVHAIALSLILSIVLGLYTLTGDPKGSLNLPLLNIAINITGVMTGGWIRLIQMKKRDWLKERSQ
ncbi:MAG: hypothetical protein DCF25_17840 [Leptolyngbya foveolarum]|uniref:Uncharacterized protein n=1 Tax=Leptolyngbya foveolarum TaxID=47253 RepID=A0A2W4TZG0_9CYAN|nr:MAG: hypothetical protein DCF25_17840 [Leptolyngbya foveolarum]